MQKRNVNNLAFDARPQGIAVPFALTPNAAWPSLMPQTKNERRDVSHVAGYRRKLLPDPENS